MRRRGVRRPGRRVFVVLAAWFALVTLLAAPAPAIYNGFKAPIHTFPWMVSIRLASAPNGHRCGGTLIQADVVLTAAHCLYAPGSTKLLPQNGLVAVVGADTSQWKSAPRIRVVAFERSTRFNLAASNRDDLAVLRLAVRISSPTIALAAAEPAAGTHVDTVGWGCTDRPPGCSTAAASLQGAHEVVITDASCGPSVFFNPHSYAPTSVCVKGASSSASIPNSGDSGGPLLVRKASGGYAEVGVASLGSDDHSKLYEEFTSIPAERAWIRSAIKNLPARVTNARPLGFVGSCTFTRAGGSTAGTLVKVVWSPPTPGTGGLPMSYRVNFAFAGTGGTGSTVVPAGQTNFTECYPNPTRISFAIAATNQAGNGPQTAMNVCTPGPKHC